MVDIGTSNEVGYYLKLATLGNPGVPDSYGADFPGIIPMVTTPYF